jgi:hypothetical protein
MGKINKTFALVLALIIAMSCLTLLTVKPANAQTSTLTLHHFEYNFIDSQTADVPFDITITAKDQFNQTYIDYTSTNTLIATLTITNTVYSQNFGLIGPFVNGTWTGEVTLDKGGGTAYFNTQSGSNATISNRFFVSGPPLPSVLDHFRFDPVGNQIVDVPFTIKITAEDQYNQTFAAYSGYNSLTGTEVNFEISIGSWVIVSLGTAGPFVNGVWSGQITLPEAFPYWSISTIGGGKSGVVHGIRAFNPYTASPTPYDPNNTPIAQSPTSSVSPTALPTASPSIPELSWLAILSLLLSVFAYAVIFRHQATNKLRNPDFS